MNTKPALFALINRGSRTVIAVCRDLLNIWNRKENVLFLLLDRPGQRPPSLFFKDPNSLVLFIFSAMSLHPLCAVKSAWCGLMKSRSGSDRNMGLQQLFKCSLTVQSKRPCCKHPHKGPEFQSSYSSLYYVANKSVGM